MDVYALWPSVVVAALCLGLLSPKRLWKFLDDAPATQSTRYVTVDGLRGFLSLAVVLHHCAISYGFHQSGEWERPPSQFYAIIGQAGFCVFFMVTAFLFWGRLLDRKQIDWFTLYCNRFFRIAPLYWIVIVSMFIVVAIKTDFHLGVPAGELIRQISRWLLPGILRELPTINGYPYTATITAGVTWTLYYEWMFYFSLPLLAIAVSRRSWFSFVPAVAWVIFVIPEALSSSFDRYLIAMFVVGMLAASLIRRWPELVGDSPLKSAAALLFVAIPLLTRSTAYEAISIASLGVFFILVSSGASLFGLLTSRSAIRLGTVSYGIYLMQGIIITLFHASHVMGSFVTKGPAQFWLVNGAITLSLTCLAAASYHFIERPCIRFGKRLATGGQPRNASSSRTAVGDAH